MDYSGLTEAQQHQQYQQYQQQYQQYQQPDPQQPQPQPQPQPYDPTQAQAYEAYYAAFQNHQYDPAAYQHQQYYAAAAYDPQQPSAQPDPTPAPHDPSQFQNPSHQTQGQAYQPPPAAAQEQYQAAPGLNPAAAAAVAALSQLTEFAENMDAAERRAGMQEMQERQWQQQPSPAQHHFAPHPHYPMQQGSGSMRAAVGGRSAYRGGGRRGGGASRGGRGRGYFGHNPSWQDGAPPAFRGRGRGRMGRGSGRGPHQASYPAPAPVQAPPAPKLPQLRSFWCDICRVDCSSEQILEQHKNGKRHKKTVQRFAEIQAQERLMAQLQPKPAPMPEMVLQKVEENQPSPMGEPNKPPMHSVVPSTASVVPEVISGSIGEANKAPAASKIVQDPVSATEQPAAESAPPVVTAFRAQPTSLEAYDRFDRRPGTKRKTVQFGPGGKRLRSFEPVVPIKAPREQPCFCTICNVMCDTRAVFDCHVSGKKHMSKISRFLAQDAIFGPIRAFIPPNQPNASQGPEPLFFGLKSREMLDQDAHGLNDLPLEFSGKQQGDQALPPKLGSEHPNEDAPPVNGGGDVKLDAEVTLAEEAHPVPDYGASIGDDKVVVPGLDVKVEGPCPDMEVGSGGAIPGPGADMEVGTGGAISGSGADVEVGSGGAMAGSSADVEVGSGGAMAGSSADVEVVSGGAMAGPSADEAEQGSQEALEPSADVEGLGSGAAMAEPSANVEELGSRGAMAIP